MNKIVLFVTYVIILVLFCIGADLLMVNKPILSDEFWGLFDGFVHGVVAIIVLLPFVKSKNDWKLIPVFFLLGGILDLDHIISAKSFLISDIISLAHRPISHSITFVIILSSIFYLFSRNVKWSVIIFLSFSSHVIRDASSGVTPILYPLEIQSIPYSLYILLEILLILSTHLFASVEYDNLKKD